MTIQANNGPANDSDDAGEASTSRLHGAADAVRDAASAAKNAAADAYSAAREKVGDAVGTAKEKSTDALDAARERAGEAYGTARAKASQARRATADGIEENPVAALLGGIALGVLVGALLPRTKREAEALGPIASRLAETARSAVGAAREAGREKLDELGVNSDNARGKVEKLVDTAVQAATSAGTAAAETVRKS